MAGPASYRKTKKRMQRVGQRNPAPRIRTPPSSAQLKASMAQDLAKFNRSLDQWYQLLKAETRPEQQRLIQGEINIARSAYARRLRQERETIKQVKASGNPAKSAAQYREAQAVLHGTATRPTSMTKKVAKELIEATPPKLRSEFMRKNAKHRRRNLFGGSQLMSSSRLSKDAYNQGYLNKKEFRVWLDAQKRAENMAPSFAKELQRQFEQGRSDRLEHEAAKQRLALLKEKKADSPKAPPTPKGQKPADQNEDYRGRTIRRTQAGFEVLGTTWNNIKQAKEYVDIMEATGGRAYLKKSNRKRNAKSSKLRTKIARTRKVVEKRVAKAAKALKGNPHKDWKKVETYRGWPIYLNEYGWFNVPGTNTFSAKTIESAKKAIDAYEQKVGRGSTKNPTASLSQGDAKGYVIEMGTHKYHAEVIAANGTRESHDFAGPKAFPAAMGWLRLRLFEVASAKNPATYVVLPLNKKPARRNPADESAKMFEKFHGTPSTEVLEFMEEEHVHSWLWNLGPMISMKIRNVQGNRDTELFFADPDQKKPEDIVMLCCNEDGTQLFCKGGDQELPEKYLMENFGMVPADFARDNALVGTILEITYRTKKSFEKQGKEEIDFYHALGSEGSRGVYPVLEYKTRSNRLVIVGGRYYIGKAEPALGGVSAGIIG